MISLRHMLDHAREALQMVRGQVRADPQIPWPQLVSLRNRLIHGYDNVDFDILWQIVTQDLPGLVDDLEKIVPSTP